MSNYMYRDKMLQKIYYKMLKKGQWMTRKEICKAVDREKTPEMVDLIEHLVDCQLIEKKQFSLKNGKLIFYYLAID